MEYNQALEIYSHSRQLYTSYCISLAVDYVLWFQHQYPSNFVTFYHLTLTFYGSMVTYNTRIEERLRIFYYLHWS